MQERWWEIKPQTAEEGLVFLLRKCVLQMKSIIVLSIIVAFIIIAFFLSKWLQKIINPRAGFGRLLFYFFSVMVLVFILSFFMVFIIINLYPDELIK
jgi:hypothetical protein